MSVIFFLDLLLLMIPAGIVASLWYIRNAMRLRNLRSLNWPRRFSNSQLGLAVERYLSDNGWRVVILNDSMTDLRAFKGRMVCEIFCTISANRHLLTFARDLSDFVRQSACPVIVVSLTEPAEWFREVVRGERATPIWYKELPTLEAVIDSAAEFLRQDKLRREALQHSGTIMVTEHADHRSVIEESAMEAAETQCLEYLGRRITVIQDRFTGSVDNAAVTRHGVSLTGWAVTDPNKGGAASAPTMFLIVDDNKVIQAIVPDVARHDIERKFGSTCLICGMKVSLSLDMIPKPFLPNFTIYAMDADDIASPLPYFEQNNRLRETQIRSGSDYMRLIQTPSTRLRDPQTLAYASLHSMRRLPNDFAIRAAALCVIGYRLLNKEVVDSELSATFDTECEALLREEPSIPKGLFLRWHTSVRLIAGYLAYQAGRDEEARDHFGAIVPFSAELASWPQAMTNVLLGLFIYGYLLKQSGNLEAAIEQWSKAPEIFGVGCSVAQFQNYYAYGEVANAVRVMQECYVAALVAKTGGPITNPALAPMGRDLDLNQLPSPFARLVSERATASDNRTEPL